MENTIFHTHTVDQLIARINSLKPNTTAKWGKMDAAQMLAHCNVPFEMTFENIHSKPNAFVKLMLKLFAKSTVVGNKPYKKGGQTAPEMIVREPKEFEKEQQRLIQYLKKTQKLGVGYFDQRESFSFGKLSAAQWSTMFQKHLEHHLNQFSA